MAKLKVKESFKNPIVNLVKGKTVDSKDIPKGLLESLKRRKYLVAVKASTSK